MMSAARIGIICLLALLPLQPARAQRTETENGVRVVHNGRVGRGATSRKSIDWSGRTATSILTMRTGLQLACGPGRRCRRKYLHRG